MSEIGLRCLSRPKPERGAARGASHGLAKSRGESHDGRCELCCWKSSYDTGTAEAGGRHRQRLIHIVCSSLSFIDPPAQIRLTALLEQHFFDGILCGARVQLDDHRGIAPPDYCSNRRRAHQEVQFPGCRGTANLTVVLVVDQCTRRHLGINKKYLKDPNRDSAIWHSTCGHSGEPVLIPRSQVDSG